MIITLDYLFELSAYKVIGRTELTRAAYLIDKSFMGLYLTWVLRIIP